MPKPRPMKRAKKESDDESSSSSSDSGPDDRNPAPKMEKASNVSRKTTGQSSTDSKSEAMKNDNGDSFWELARNRRITVRSFKGKTLIDIREYYEKDGKHLPGKKGVSLSAMEWNKLKDLASDIDNIIQKM